MRPLYRLLSLALALVFSAGAAAEEKLVFAVDLIRHGDRNPLIEFPADPHPWPGGLGRLTELGMRQEYELGSRMRSLYVDRLHLLLPRYRAGSVYARSTDLERTLVSAHSFLSGLYPSGSAQSIPIHTVKTSEDSLLIPVYDRREYEDLFNKYVAPSPAWRERTSALEPRFKKWSLATGLAITNLRQLIAPGDALYIMGLRHIPPPPGLDSDDVRTIMEAGEWANVAKYAPPQIWRSVSRELMRAVASYLREASRGKGPLKYVLFSAHDYTLLIAMSALGAPPREMPSYASRLNFSMFRSESGEYSVKVSFNGRPVAVSGCGAGSCTLPQFAALSRSL